MNDQAYKNACIAKIKASRKKLAIELKELGFRVWDSQTNFLLVQPRKGNAEELSQRLKEHKILVRYFKQPRLDDKLRITVGNDEQNRILVETLFSLVK